MALIVLLFAIRTRRNPGTCTHKTLVVVVLNGLDFTQIRLGKIKINRVFNFRRTMPVLQIKVTHVGARQNSISYRIVHR